MSVGLRYGFIFFLALLLTISSCEEMIDVGQPKTELNSAVVFQDDLTATSAVSALYYQLSRNSVLDFTIPLSLSGDDLMMEDGKELSQFYHNELTSINSNVETIWRNAYTGIYNANAIIEGLEKSTNVTTPVKNQLTGEAKFFRAFYHFYLVNIFGDVPYITTTDYRITGTVTRMPVADVYVKIIEDLVEARTLLAGNYAYSKGERVRANTWAATGLLARVYLYTKDYARAEEQAGRVIEQTALYELISDDLNKVFLQNSKEAILQLIPNYPQAYTMEGAWLNKPYYSLENPRIPQALMDAFETNDNRKANWIATGNSGGNTWHYTIKYKETNLDTVGANEYTMVLRLAEQYLVRAEARAMRDNLTGLNSSESDLNVIRNRAGLLPTTATTREELLIAIDNERRKELFTEWGHRWFDLKRRGIVNDVLPSVKPAWNNTYVLYPIPFSELRLNPNLKPQNDGY